MRKFNQIYELWLDISGPTKLYESTQSGPVKACWKTAGLRTYKKGVTLRKLCGKRLNVYYTYDYRVVKFYSNNKVAIRALSVGVWKS